MAPGDRVAHLYPQALGAHFNRLLRYAWVTVGLFFNPGHHTGVINIYYSINQLIGAAVAQSVQCLTTDKTGVRSPAEEKDFSSNLCVQISSEAHLASYSMGTGGGGVLSRG
jgi:hypothetical protein